MSDDVNSATVTRLVLTTTDDISIEAEVRSPPRPSSLAAVAHPHPRYGGSMHNPVVDALVDGFGEAGAATVKFNFRGVGRSGGVHDGGTAERLDLLAAVEHLAHAHPRLPIIVSGYSFGAVVALTTDHPRVTGWCVVAPPLGLSTTDDFPALGDQGSGDQGSGEQQSGDQRLGELRPTAVVTGDGDQFVDHQDWQAMAARHRSIELTVVNGADHFFAVGLDRVKAVATAVARRAASAGSAAN